MQEQNLISASDGMDRPVARKFWNRSRRFWVFGGASLFVLLIAAVVFSPRGTTLSAAKSHLTIETVTRGEFRDYISVNGTVAPIRTVYLDAMAGGRVEEVVAEEGTSVKKGDILLRLSNTDLQMSMMNQESDVADQMNNLRNSRLSMEQNRLDLKGQLLDVEYSLKTAQREYEDQQALSAHRAGLTLDLDKARDSYEMLVKKRALLLETIRQDSLFRAVQVEQLEASIGRMQANLSLVRQTAEGLTIRAPVDGQLSSLGAEVGEYKSSGEQLGYINILDSYKIEADVDEHYIGRVSKGIVGTLNAGGKDYPVVLAKVHPEVKNGTFKTELEFTDTVPPDLHIGQSFSLSLELGRYQTAILLPRGSFFQTTAGQWVLVVNESGKRAVRRAIHLGRQNPDDYEVLDGLKPGEKVITSDYTDFAKARVVVIKNQE